MLRSDVVSTHGLLVNSDLVIVTTEVIDSFSFAVKTICLCPTHFSNFQRADFILGRPLLVNIVIKLILYSCHRVLEKTLSQLVHILELTLIQTIILLSLL
uniref:Uncharacterized protein n=1 Tax=Cacopsylla melanoneura TaxID=428564 RepID=A0A8D8Z303_9HEMI